MSSQFSPLCLSSESFVVADTPKVKIYNNYVLYDRFMPYNRFRNSFIPNTKHTDDSDLAEKEHYDNNYHNFLVVKFCKKSKDVVLFDSMFDNLYIYGYSVPQSHVYVDASGEFPRIKILDTIKDACCLNIFNDECCPNIHNNGNGYCDACQYNSEELDQLNPDYFLTYSEFISLPEFKDFYDLEFNNDDNNDDNNEEKYDDEDSQDCESESCRRYHTFDDDTDFSDYDDDRHGPEDTIEDDSDEEDVYEKKESKWMEGDDECFCQTFLGLFSTKKYTYKNNKLHSFNGNPAVSEVDMDGHSKYVWYKDGVKHRLEGVAEQIHNDMEDIASYDWYIDGKSYNKEDFKKEVKRLNEERALKDACEKKE